MTTATLALGDESMRVLVACEFSGIVRQAFAARGHDAWSCDLLPTEQPGQHIQADVLSVLGDGWDLAICHPPCTFLAASGARWWASRQDEQQAALVFVQALWNAPIERIAIENPIGYLSTAWRPPTQIICPSQFGHAETKRTCLWLRGLSPLMSTHLIVGTLEARIHRMPQSAERWKNRSRTYVGIASGMAAQWG